MTTLANDANLARCATTALRAELGGKIAFFGGSAEKQWRTSLADANPADPSHAAGFGDLRTEPDRGRLPSSHRLCSEI